MRHNDIQESKALLGTLFIWFEKGNDNIIPSNVIKLELPVHILEQKDESRSVGRKATAVAKSSTLP